VLLLQAADLRGGGGPFEIARLRRALAAAGRMLPPRLEPLLLGHARKAPGSSAASPGGS
jgi:hypothetical protein